MELVKHLAGNELLQLAVIWLALSALISLCRFAQGEQWAAWSLRYPRWSAALELARAVLVDFEKIAIKAQSLVDGQLRNRWGVVGRFPSEPPPPPPKDGAS